VVVLSDRALAMATDLRFCAPLEDANRQGLVGCPGDGAFMEISLREEEGVIRAAAYRTHGCPSSRAAGAAICRLLSTGMTLDKALEITQQDQHHSTTAPCRQTSTITYDGEGLRRSKQANNARITLSGKARIANIRD